jgi:hypothetical protein
MNTLENENDRHAEQLAAKVSRLKNVSKMNNKFLENVVFLFKIAIDIDNESKEHNRFLDTMVISKSTFINKHFLHFSVLISIPLEVFSAEVHDI